MSNAQTRDGYRDPPEGAPTEGAPTTPNTTPPAAHVQKQDQTLRDLYPVARGAVSQVEYSYVHGTPVSRRRDLWLCPAVQVYSKTGAHEQERRRDRLCFTSCAVPFVSVRKEPLEVRTPASGPQTRVSGDPLLTLDGFDRTGDLQDSPGATTLDP